MVKNLPTIQETQFNPWVRKIPWRSEQQPTPVFLPGESHGQRSLVGYSPWKSDITKHLTQQTPSTSTYWLLDGAQSLCQDVSFLESSLICLTPVSFFPRVSHSCPYPFRRLSKTTAGSSRFHQINHFCYWSLNM